MVSELGSNGMIVWPSIPWILVAKGAFGRRSSSLGGDSAIGHDFGLDRSGLDRSGLDRSGPGRRRSCGSPQYCVEVWRRRMSSESDVR